MITVYQNSIFELLHHFQGQPERFRVMGKVIAAATTSEHSATALEAFVWVWAGAAFTLVAKASILARSLQTSLKYSFVILF